MAPKKLTEADKTSILSLYRQPQETTSTLAERYGVSNSTISRLLKASLPEAEYGVLIQQKRGAPEKAVIVPEPAVDASPKAKRGRKKADPLPIATEDSADVLLPSEPSLVDEVVVQPSPKVKPRRKSKVDAQPEPVAAEAVAQEIALVEPLSAESIGVEAADTPAGRTKPTRRRRSQATEAPPEPTEVLEPTPEPIPEPTQLSLPDPEPVAAPAKPARPVLKSAQPAPETLEAEADLDDDDDSDDWDSPVLGDDYDDDDGDDGDDDEAYPWEGDRAATPHMETLEIYPLTADVLPALCYVVVERTSSELVVLPLRTFAELGQIPEAEGESRTLPVFENHNVARRFSRRNQRVVKVPDGTLLQTTSPYLQAKGITRLFIDGQVFSLGQDPVEPIATVAED